jgi:hypothetical protein
MKTMISSIGRDTGAQLFAVLDDITAVCHFNQALHVFDNARNACPRHGLELADAKCKLLWPHGTDAPAELVQACRARRITLHTGSIELLGGLVSFDEEAHRRFTIDTVAEQAELFESIRHADMPAALGYQILRRCAVPRVGYLSRTSPPAPATDGLTDWDQRVLRCFSDIMQTHADRDLSSVATLNQIHMPLMDCGAGLRPACPNDADYFSSLTQALPDILPNDFERARTAARHDDELILSSFRGRPRQTCIDHLRTAFNRIAPHTTQGDDAPVPPTFGAVLERFRDEQKYPANLQHMIVQRLNRASIAARDRLPAADRARLISGGGANGGARWLTADPTDHDRAYIQSDSFRIAMRHRLGLSPPHAYGSRCACGRSWSSIRPDHHHTCRTTAAALTARHNHVLQVLASIAREAGMDVTVEPRPEHGAGRRSDDDTDRIRPDLKLRGYYGVTLIDVSIVHPSAASYMVRAATTPLAAATIRERQKRAKYDQLARDSGAQFVPFVFESFGSFGRGVRQTLAIIAREAAHFQSEEFTAAFHARALNRLCAALQIGNAMVAVMAERLSRP